MLQSIYDDLIKAIIFILYRALVTKISEINGFKKT